MLELVRPLRQGCGLRNQLCGALAAPVLLLDRVDHRLRRSRAGRLGRLLLAGIVDGVPAAVGVAAAAVLYNGHDPRMSASLAAKCPENTCCAFWAAPKLVGGFVGEMKCAKHECLYCRMRMPSHWAGREAIFLSFLTMFFWITVANFILYMLFVAFFVGGCEEEFLADALEDYAKDGIDRTPAVFGEIMLGLLWLLLISLLTYTGYWAYATRNIMWQLLFCAIQLLYFIYLFAEMIEAFRFASICNGMFALNGVLFLGMIVAAGHTIVFGCLT